jgi:hypothetical protein
MDTETMTLRRTGAYPEITRLNHERYVASQRKEDKTLSSREHSAAKLEYRKICDALPVEKQKAREAFAAEHGWSISKSTFNLEMLWQARGARCCSDDWDHDRTSGVLDHVEYFSVGPRKHAAPAALLSHTYDDWSEVLKFAEEHNLDAQALPGSWYYPGGCIAALFTRKPGVIELRAPGREALDLEPYGGHCRDSELRNEIVMHALAAKAGDKASLQLLKRLSRQWCIRCSTSRAQRMYDRSNQLYAALMRAETQYNQYHSYADGVSLSEHFIRDNPTHPASRLPESIAYLQHRDNWTRDMKEHDRECLEQREYLENAPPRGVPTKFYIDHTLELPANVRKARRLDLEGHEWLCVEEHARWALEWARETDRKTLPDTRKPKTVNAPQESASQGCAAQ